MKNLTIIATTILGMLFCSNTSMGQGIDCGGSYDLALAQYNYGLADSALSFLEPCLFNKRIHKELTRGESTNIYRLAALSSIMIGDSEAAEKFVREMLKYAPDYAESWREGDLMEFRHMIEGFSSQPSFKLGLRGGVNFPLLSLQKNYTDPAKLEATFLLEGRTGYQVGILTETAISRNLAFEAGLGMQFGSFNYLVQG